MAEKKVVRYEDSAVLTTVKCWRCTECGRIHPVGNEEVTPSQEHLARWCCATDLPCDTDGCDGRRENHYTSCPSCLVKSRRESFLKLEEIEWNGDYPVACRWGDPFFFDEDSLVDHLLCSGTEIMKLEDLELVEAIPQSPPHFDMSDFLCDYLPDEMDVPADAHLIENKVNAWLREHATGVYRVTNRRFSFASIRKHLPDDWDSDE